MKFVPFLFVLGAFSLLNAVTLKVAAAANLSVVIDVLEKEYEKTHPDVKITTSVASSGKLTAQIQNGAPYDIFLSADMKYAQKLYKKGFAYTRPLVYAQGYLVLFTKKNIDISSGIRSLVNQDIRSIAVANPKTAPYGKITEDVLRKSGELHWVHTKLVYGESIGQTLLYGLQSADVAIVAKSALFHPKMVQYKQHKHWIDIDRSLYKPLDQGGVVLKNAKNKDVAKSFFLFLFSKEAQKIWESYGYGIPQGK